jgi:hypothetical protein
MCVCRLAVQNADAAFYFLDLQIVLIKDSAKQPRLIRCMMNPDERAKESKRISAFKSGFA